MSLPGPAGPLHKVPVPAGTHDEPDATIDVYACNAAEDCDEPATLQWAYEVTTEEEAQALGLNVGDQVPVMGCDEHTPAEPLP
jgi:hypothetical protein